MIRKSKYKTILGIAVLPGEISVTQLSREGERVEVQNAFSKPLSLDLFSSDPELAGTELRSCLDEAGIKAKHCIVALPLQMVFHLGVSIPAGLSEEDVESYIHLQAERGFPYSPEDLAIAVSRRGPSGDGREALVSALYSGQLEALRKVCKIAHLTLVGIFPGIAALAEPGGEQSEVRLFARGEQLEMAFLKKGSIVALRSLQFVHEGDQESSESMFDAVFREFRITLGGLEDFSSKTLGSVSVYGSPEKRQRLLSGLKGPFEKMDIAVLPGTLEIESLIRGFEKGSGVSLDSLWVAARWILGKKPDFDYLPPRRSGFQRLAGKISARGALWLASAAAFLFLVAASSFLIQYRYLAGLEKKWKKIEPGVAEIENVQEKVRNYRMWYYDSSLSLSIMSALTGAFPEKGSVWVRSLEIKGLEKVTCGGEARSNADWLNMLERLRKLEGVEELQVLQVRGDDPLRFSFSFRWKGEPHGI